MLENWKAVAITDAAWVSYVEEDKCEVTRHNPKFHVFLLNDSAGYKRYHFSDGTVFDSGPRDFRFLPKGSNYRVERFAPCKAWTIQFSTAEPISCGPFNVTVQNYNALKQYFMEALSVKNSEPVLRGMVMRKCIYAILELLYKEERKKNISEQKALLLRPAVVRIDEILAENGIVHITDLAKLCGISETYLRRLFRAQYGVSPKEFVIQKRMEQARQFLLSGHTVAETAVACGYAEPCHFSREFTRRMGKAPKAYQREYMAE